MHSISMLGRYTLMFITCVSICSQTALSAANEAVSGLPMEHQEPEQVLQLLTASTSETNSLIGNHCILGKPRLLQLPQ